VTFAVCSPALTTHAALGVPLTAALRADPQALARVQVPIGLCITAMNLGHLLLHGVSQRMGIM
jgi:hypothetical protein